MERAKTIANIYPGNSINKQSEDYSCKRENRINKKGNKNIVRQNPFGLENHYQGDEPRQKPQTNTQRIHRASVVKVALVKIIKQICELAYNCKDYSNKADVKNNVKMNRNSAFNGRARATKNLEIKEIGLDELNGIKAKEKRRDVIQRKHHEVTYADHIESGLAAVSSENVRKSVKNQQEARDDLQQNQRPPAVVLKLMP